MQKRDHGKEEQYESQFFVTHDLKTKEILNLRIRTKPANTKKTLGFTCKGQRKTIVWQKNETETTHMLLWQHLSSSINKGKKLTCSLSSSIINKSTSIALLFKIKTNKTKNLRQEIS